jgi:hypothetical protein
MTGILLPNGGPVVGKAVSTLVSSTQQKEWNTLQPWPAGTPERNNRITFTDYHRLTTSQGNKKPYRSGGNFLVTHKRYRDNSLSLPQHFSNQWGAPYAPGRHFSGSMYARFNGVGEAQFPGVTASSDLQIAPYGTRAIANSIPTNPLSGFSVFAGELREGIPKLAGTDFFKTRSRRALKAGDEYLNLEFGWKPLINDVKSFSNAVRNSDKEIIQLVRNSGKQIRRTYRFPIESSSSSFNDGNYYPQGGPSIVSFYDGAGNRPRIVTTDTETERWFVGAFTYYVPPIKYDEDGHIKLNSQLRNFLFGTRVTPETLWNLAPWSWAADWFGNTGDILHNISAFQNDGLVMPYGYIMERKLVRVTYEQKDLRFTSYPGKSFYLTQVLETEVKSRRVATPFGFGLNPSTFSGRQWAILGALGLTRANRQF